MDVVKMLTWNVRQGGKKAINDIIESLINHHADLIVLTEYRNNDTGRFLISTLKQKGWQYIQSSYPPSNKNSILILSIYPLEFIEPPFSQEKGSHRWNEVYIPQLQLFLLGIHVPNVGEQFDKRFFWEHIMQYAHHGQNAQAVIIGDLNSVRVDEKKTGALQYSNFIMKLIKSGWGDAWKQIHHNSIDHSWFSHKQNGFRLDYLFLSPKLLPALASCDFSHDERKKNFSDHSVLTAKLKINNDL